ncbi:hypothetical protein [Rhodococcus sp. T7]|uniref:hypothetical protein n=1 Tax=Rhodococcus sp. T7 TaxID=627444 RepID=UPI00135C0025|nr:hypothetical protein [Rhodococcus sp. T7]KAF0958461.1 hypothetical protein MLGJGCBP_08440 [Rhodococcus sp. T7]
MSAPAIDPKITSTTPRWAVPTIPLAGEVWYRPGERVERTPIGTLGHVICVL